MDPPGRSPLAEMWVLRCADVRDLFIGSLVHFSLELDRRHRHNGMRILI